MNNRVDVPFNINTPTSERRGSRVIDDSNLTLVIVTLPITFSLSDRDYDHNQSILHRSLNDNGLRKNNNIDVNLPSSLNKKENCQCSICFEEIKLDEKIFELSCKHDFHESCLKNWIKYKQDCPVCRKKISHKTKKQSIL